MNRRNLLIGGAGVIALGAGASWLAAAQLGSGASYAAAARRIRAPLPLHPAVHDMIRYATLAPNGHNAQPWRFAHAPGRITILPDFSRRTPVVDPDDHHLFVSLGCAAQNLTLAGVAGGYHGAAVFDPAGDGTIAFVYRAGRPQPSALAAAIPLRQSTRGLFDGRRVSAADLAVLSAAASDPLVDLALITERVAIDRVRDLVVAGNSLQMADPAFVRELKAWLRFNPRQALRTGDGLYSATTGNPALPEWIGPMAFDWFDSASAQNDTYAQHIRSSAGIAVFVGAAETPGSWVAVGQACQRFALQATALGLKLAFINQPIEVAALRPELASLIGLPGRRPDVVLRFGYGPLQPYASRRPLEQVIMG